MRRSNNYGYQPLPQNIPGLNANDTLEEENERTTEELKEKIGALKSLTIDIGNEVRHQDRLLRGIDGDIDRSGVSLSATISRVIRLGKNSGSRHMCYMFLFVVFIFFILYLVLKLR